MVAHLIFKLTLVKSRFNIMFLHSPTALYKQSGGVSSSQLHIVKIDTSEKRNTL